MATGAISEILAEGASSTRSDVTQADVLRNYLELKALELGAEQATARIASPAGKNETTFKIEARNGNGGAFKDYLTGLHDATGGTLGFASGSIENGSMQLTFKGDPAAVIPQLEQNDATLLAAALRKARGETREVSATGQAH